MNIMKVLEVYIITWVNFLQKKKKLSYPGKGINGFE